ncbi:vacuolar protein-sorting-associated protein 25-like [Stylophora pistillata]|uniref:vacuolar protein-sorting-associated protein 25-like n=1 Tax=Stylophora pistillata TaxID=50429 RepID=UPI000C03A047|nr:vacuolar protein-sorting-associated protein 25-like [Stylophora pistillata]
MANTFDWPWQYNFPPFFTLQPNLDTRRKQIAGWCDLVLAFYKHHKSYILDVTEAQTSELFFNKKIDRKLSLETINLILEELQSKGNIEWEDIEKTKMLCHVAHSR